MDKQWLKQEYTISRIPKGKGRWREVYVPNKEFQHRLDLAFHEVRGEMLARCDYEVCHGFMPGRSPVTNASYHIGYKYTLTMDLADWFNTVTDKHVLPYIRSWVLGRIMVDGIARQGLSTSPMLANLAAVTMDKELKDLGAMYTRYADDLTFSTNSRDLVLALKQLVPIITARHGFPVSERKTKIQGFREGNRLVTGLAVNGKKVLETRKNRHTRRAAKHLGHKGGAAGLACWWRAPRLTCPICWRGGYDSARFLSWHLNGQHSIRLGDFAIEAVIVQRGNVPDYAKLYKDIRRQHLLEVMRGNA